MVLSSLRPVGNISQPKWRNCECQDRIGQRGAQSLNSHVTSVESVYWHFCISFELLMFFCFHIFYFNEWSKYAPKHNMSNFYYKQYHHVQFKMRICLNTGVHIYVFQDH